MQRSIIIASLGWLSLGSPGAARNTGDPFGVSAYAAAVDDLRTKMPGFKWERLAGLAASKVDKLVDGKYEIVVVYRDPDKGKQNFSYLVRCPSELDCTVLAAHRPGEK